ncbi:MAG: hypothetical protein QM753_20635 [Thermomicrobiales bacterium]
MFDQSSGACVDPTVGSALDEIGDATETPTVETTVVSDLEEAVDATQTPTAEPTTSPTDTPTQSPTQTPLWSLYVYKYTCPVGYDANGGNANFFDDCTSPTNGVSFSYVNLTQNLTASTGDSFLGAVVFSHLDFSPFTLTEQVPAGTLATYFRCVLPGAPSSYTKGASFQSTLGLGHGYEFDCLFYNIPDPMTPTATTTTAPTDEPTSTATPTDEPSPALTNTPTDTPSSTATEIPPTSTETLMSPTATVGGATVGPTATSMAVSGLPNTGQGGGSGSILPLLLLGLASLALLTAIGFRTERPKR